MSSILSAQNLQTLRRRNIGRRWPCCLSPAFLSALRPRAPDRFCPNGTSDLHSVKAIVVGVLDLGRSALTRLANRRQDAPPAAALGLGLALCPRALDDLLLLVHADDEMAQDLVEDLQPAIELLHEIARSDDHLEDVDALLVGAYLVRELPAPPVVCLLDLAIHPRHDRCDLLVHLGDLLLGAVGRKDVDELVLSSCHRELLLGYRLQRRYSARARRAPSPRCLSGHRARLPPPASSPRR